MGPLIFRLHRWFSWLVGLQVLVWSCSGLLFAWLPFHEWVKGHDVAEAPRLVLPPQWREALRALPDELNGAPNGAPPERLQAVMTPHGAVLKLGAQQWHRLDGQPWREPQAAEVAAFARTLYRGTGAVLGVERLPEVARQLGIVAELGTRKDVWRVRFDDALHTRLYFDGPSGEYLTVRTRAWVGYDFFWRLHIMDYEGGEDFNGALLRTASLVFFALTLAGLALSWLALRRHARRMKP